MKTAMKIGIDFDNTLVNYDLAFPKVGKERPASGRFRRRQAAGQGLAAATKTGRLSLGKAAGHRLWPPHRGRRALRRRFGVSGSLPEGGIGAAFYRQPQDDPGAS